MATLLSLFSPLLLLWAQAPAAPDYTQNTALELLPADTLAVAEFSLEPWDRLRSQTRAAKILSGQKILRTALAKQNLLDSGASDELRKALGGVRFTVAVSRESLLDGGCMLAVEAVGLSAAEFDWPALLRLVGEQEVRQIKRGWMIAVPILDWGPLPSNAVASWLGTLEQERLHDQANWREMRKGMVTSNDLLRVSAAIWNLDTAFLSYLSSASGAEIPSEIIDACMSTLLGDARDRAGFIYSSMIDGEEILERWRMDLGRPTASFLGLAGSADELLRIAALAPAQAVSVSISEVSGVAIGAYVQDLFELVKSILSSLDAQPSESESSFMDEVVRDLVGVAECFDGQLIAYSPIEAMELGTPVMLRMQTSGKESVQAKWDELPAQVRNMLPLVLSQLPGGTSYAWEGDELVVGGVGDAWAKAPEQPSQRWESVRRNVENFAGDKHLLSLSLFDKSIDGYWLSSSTVRELGSLVGLTLPRMSWPAEAEKLRRASYQATRKSGRWIESESRSTFGLLLNGINAASMEALSGANTEALDESEF